MSLTRAGLILLALVGTLACVLEVRPDQVAGEYRGDFGGESNVLTLKPTGEFTWVTRKDGGSIRTRAGSWTLRTTEGRSWIVLQELGFGGESISQENPIDLVLGRPHISVDPDRGWSLLRK